MAVLRQPCGPVCCAPQACIEGEQPQRQQCDEAVDVHSLETKFTNGTAHARPVSGSRLPPSAHGSARRARGGQLCRRTQLLRGQACRSMFEQSGIAAPRVLRHRPGIEHRACPKRSAGTWAAGGVFFWVLCLHEQEKYLACRGETRPQNVMSVQQCNSS